MTSIYDFNDVLYSTKQLRFSEKNTDHEMLKWYSSLFSNTRLYCTNGNKLLFGKFKPDGYDIWEKIKHIIF